MSDETSTADGQQQREVMPRYEYKVPTGAGDATWDSTKGTVSVLAGSVLRYDAPTEPVVPPEAWNTSGAA